MSSRNLVTALALVACACSKPTSSERGEARPAESVHSDEPGHADLPRRVRLSREVIDAAKIKTEPARREKLALLLELPGEIAPDPDRSARVASPVAGRIERVELKEGTSVTKGAALVVVRVPELGRLRAEQAAAAAKSTAARRNAQRLRGLLEKRLTSEQEVLNAEAEADSLETQAKGLKSEVSALGGGGATTITLRAPVAGVVVFRDAVVGQPVTAEQTLANIADLSELWFLGRVFEKDLGRLRTGSNAEIELNAYPRERFEGKLEYVGKQVDPVARTLTARVRLTNRSDLLRIGLFGTARVALEEDKPRAPVLVVPRAAVTDFAGKPSVFVRHADDDFELHQVVLGDSTPGKIEVVSGLSDGEEVVVEGAFSVKSAMLRSTLGEDEH